MATPTDCLAARACRCRPDTWDVRERDRDCPACIGKPVRDTCDECGQHVPSGSAWQQPVEVVPPPLGFADFVELRRGHRKCVEAPA